MQLIVIKEYRDFYFLLSSSQAMSLRSLENSVAISWDNPRQSAMSLSAAGEEEQKICLVASPGFAVNYGVNYYRKAQQKLQQALPNYEVQLGIACDDQPGFALEAIAARVDRLYFLKSSSYWAKIDSLCHEAGIRLFDQEQLSCL